MIKRIIFLRPWGTAHDHMVDAIMKSHIHLVALGDTKPQCCENYQLIKYERLMSKAHSTSERWLTNTIPIKSHKV